VTEMESHEAETNREMDRLLAQAMSGPLPSLPANFDQRVVRAAREASRDVRSQNRYTWMLLAGYAVVSVVTSVVLMRGAGLDWLPTGAIVGLLAMVAGTYLGLRARRTPAKTELSF
jgi:hypothetical protein